MSAPSSPLLPSANTAHTGPRTRRATTVLALICLIAGCTFIALRGERPFLSKDPVKRAEYYLGVSPVIDGHIDVPELARTVFGNDLGAFDLRKETVRGLPPPFLREADGWNRPDTLTFPVSGKVTWAVSSGHGTWPLPSPFYVPSFFPRQHPLIPSYVDCKPSDDDFLTPTHRVRDTLEQIDIAKLMIERYGDVFEFVTTAQGVRNAVRAGKVASLLGVEGCVLAGSRGSVPLPRSRILIRHPWRLQGASVGQFPRR